jgi:hypothetical protein
MSDKNSKHLANFLSQLFDLRPKYFGDFDSLGINSAAIFIKGSIKDMVSNLNTVYQGLTFDDINNCELVIATKDLTPEQSKTIGHLLNCRHIFNDNVLTEQLKQMQVINKTASLCSIKDIKSYVNSK